MNSFWIHLRQAGSLWGEGGVVFFGFVSFGANLAVGLNQVALDLRAEGTAPCHHVQLYGLGTVLMQFRSGRLSNPAHLSLHLIEPVYWPAAGLGGKGNLRHSGCCTQYPQVCGKWRMVSAISLPGASNSPVVW